MSPLTLLNGQKDKQPMSGLRNIKRDWSDPQLTQSASSQASQPIEWPTSPGRPSRPKPSKPAGYDDRIARIQAVLESNRQSSQKLLSSSSSVPQKREAQHDGDTSAPVAKKRVLPANWGRQDNVKQATPHVHSPGSASSFGSASIAPRLAPPPEDEAELPAVARIFLSTEQQQILKLVEAGNNVFFTGSAGTGKSVLLREIIKSLRRKYQKSEDAVAITASTGIAACNIGGVTLHSFGGIGLGLEKPEQLATKIKRNKKAVTRWLRSQVLIMDEISMVEGDLFDKLERIACILRKNNKPFGGIQLIVTGDFFQLPPVVRGGQVKFAFEAQKWGECIQRTFNLTKVFRQKDQEFVDMLNEMRFGRLSKASIAKFQSLSRPVVYDDGIVPTELFPRREDVDRANKARMQTLQGRTRTFWASDTGSGERAYLEKQLSHLMAPPQLELRIDSQVMLIKNTDETLVNGSMGKVVDFVDPQKWNKPAIPEEDGKPKKPTSAGVKEPKEYPVVRFPIQGQPGQYRRELILPETWKIELPNGEVLASRSQLPLILAWAMSIHKSQGQTIDRVKVDLNKVFEKGQAYVALSRATSLQGLEVLGFNPAKVQAHPTVAKWSTTLESITSA